MTKPVVKYERAGAYIPGVGGQAIVVPMDHPDTYRVSNGQPARTSRIVSHDSNTGEFETLNTRYVPV